MKTYELSDDFVNTLKRLAREDVKGIDNSTLVSDVYDAGARDAEIVMAREILTVVLNEDYDENL